MGNNGRRVEAKIRRFLVACVPFGERKRLTLRSRRRRGYRPSAMVKTPWGDAARLRDRKMRPGRGTPRAEAERNQRERLFAAMVATVSEKGYEATTVADR